MLNLMNRIFILFISLFMSASAYSLSVGCDDGSDFKAFDGGLEIIKGSDGDTITYTVVAPKVFDGKKYTGAFLLAGGTGSFYIKSPLSLTETEVSEWPDGLVAFIHTSKQPYSLTLIVEYGMYCESIITQPIQP